MRRCVGRFHVAAGDEPIDRLVTARNRMAPGGELPWRKAQRGHRERCVVHAELRIDEHVERIVANDGCDDGRPRTAAAEFDEAIGASLDLRGDFVLARIEMVDAYVKALAIEIGEPAAKVTTRRADMEERGRESYAQPAAFIACGDGRMPFARAQLDHPRGERAI